MKIPTLKYIKKNLKLFELSGYEPCYLLRVDRNTYGPGAWYQKHIGEIFYVSVEDSVYSSFYKEYKAITCLTKHIKTPDCTSRIGGWFSHDDITIITRTQFDRINKLKRIIN